MNLRLDQLTTRLRVLVKERRINQAFKQVQQIATSVLFLHSRMTRDTASMYIIMITSSATYNNIASMA
jgi:hypothetical protein